ncbi:hypothetical protein [Streptomyces sp. NPDC050264]|uniref:hypothetical protein n=1 Tax=Streptomyces sp. NPDC050264 TaxID=3155038 RepID=UPI0034263093
MATHQPVQRAAIPGERFAAREPATGETSTKAPGRQPDAPDADVVRTRGSWHNWQVVA